MKRVVFTLVGLIVCSLGQAQASAQDLKGCKRCDQQGVVPCKQHDAELREHEGHVLFCSVIAACPDCGGSLWVDCDRCDGGPKSAEVEARRAEIAAWAAADPMAEYLKRSVPRVETTHFELIIDTGTLKEGKKKVDGHILMHRVAEDVEEVARLVDQHYGLGEAKAREASRGGLAGMAPDSGESGGAEPGGSDAGGPVANPSAGATPVSDLQPGYFGKMRMWIWNNPDDHRTVMRDFLHSGASGDFKMLGKDPIFSVWTEGQFKTVPAVRMLFAHNASHMLVSNLYKELWVGDLTGGWFDAGLGHWYEYELFGLSLNACIEEANVLKQYHGGQWRAALRKDLGPDASYVLPKLLPMNTGAMTLEEQALCFSFYDWLVHEHVDLVPAILRGLKRERPARELLMELLGKSLFAMEDDWRAWVQASYPVKDPKPKAWR
ncbi:MAG: hypothetical protein H6830_06695 [Planctomycetes bacterium]|nr:hypothetical protein [Planctomycetota bacterium]MCB9911276.1 hypothetical protein [Planctomycetota bacterium]MCB9911539.1 hypothetical protein [Planctomycetota bacterium]HRV80904.1 hypothetical protein [Planctomycetota bacterium]